MFQSFFTWLVKPLADILESNQNEAPNIIIGTEVQQAPVILPKESIIYRPANFKNYVGQENAKNLIQSTLKGTLKLKKPFPHCLIWGGAGNGKTTLGKIIAKALEKPHIEFITSSIKSIDSIKEFIYENNEGVIILDELHGLPRNICEQFYPIMEEGLVDKYFDNEQTYNFTLIGCTTELGELLKNRQPFIDRFKIRIPLEAYNVNDIKKIIKQYRLNVFPEVNMNSGTYHIIANNSRCTPRLGISLLESTIYLDNDVNKALQSNNIVYRGFTTKDIELLRILKDNENGLGVQAISSYLLTSKDNYIYHIEPYLLQHKLIIRTPKGRLISPLGKRLLTIIERV